MVASMVSRPSFPDQTFGLVIFLLIYIRLLYLITIEIMGHLVLHLINTVGFFKETELKKRYLA